MEHVAFTDHSIRRHKEQNARSALSGRALVPFWPEVDDRDTALAYAVAAMSEPGLRKQALSKLEAAASQYSDDVAILAQLAQVYGRMGREDQAAELYTRVLKFDPSHVVALVNLGTYRINQGSTDEAVRLWTSALERNPALTGPRLNLAVAHYRAGNLVEAEAAFRQALHYDPDSDLARKLLAELRSPLAK